MNRYFVPVHRIVCAALTCLAMQHAAAAPWPDVPFRYFAHGYPVQRVLRDFAGAFGLKLEASPDVQGRVNGDYSSSTPAQFLDALATMYGLTWYCHDGILYVVRSTESTSRTLPVGVTDIGNLKAELVNLGVFEPRFGWAEFPERGIVIVSGPPAYVDMLSSVVARLGTGPSGGREIRVFPLKYARADDREIRFHGQSMVMQGVASMVRDLMALPVQNLDTAGRPGLAAPTSVPVDAPSSVPSIPPLPSLPGLGESADGGSLLKTGASATPLPAHAAPLPAAPTPALAIESATPTVLADQRLNAVVVSDAPERMSAYEALIRRLDVPSAQIEISAMILDVDIDQASSLGVNWTARIGAARFGFNDDMKGTTVLAVDSDSFFARVQALATLGYVRILGRPSVMTLENLDAILTLSETYYVRTSGGVAGSGGGGRSGGGGIGGALFPVSSGTLLKVTPHLVEESGVRKVDMAVDIEDGQLEENRRVDSLPTVLQGSISTEAVVGEDDSLLIAGYFMDADNNTTHKVPVLGDIPVLGALFRDRSKENKRSERLFIIRPHVVAPASAGSSPAEGGTDPPGGPTAEGLAGPH